MSRALTRSAKTDVQLFSAAVVLKISAETSFIFICWPSWTPARRILPAAARSGSDAAERPKPIRHQSAPVTSESAPTMTCAVATSAALFVQIVAAPSATCTKINASQKMASFVSESFAAEPLPRQPRRRRPRQQNQKRDEAMDHLQNNLKRGDGIFAVDFHAMRIVAGDGGGTGVRPDFSVGGGKIRNRQTRVLMPHRRADNQLDENQNRDEQNMAAQVRAGRKMLLAASRRSKLQCQNRLVKSAMAHIKTKNSLRDGSP